MQLEVELDLPVFPTRLLQSTQIGYLTSLSVAQGAHLKPWAADGNFNNGFPQIERPLNWVHPATRFSIPILVQNTGSDIFRAGETVASVGR